VLDGAVLEGDRNRLAYSKPARKYLRSSMNGSGTLPWPARRSRSRSARTCELKLESGRDAVTQHRHPAAATLSVSNDDLAPFEAVISADLLRAKL